MSKETKSTTPLSTMLGSGETFEANGKSYTIMPMPLAHTTMFMSDNVPLSGYLFALNDENSRKIINKWLGEVSVELADGTIITTKYCRNKDNELMSVDKVMADGWNIQDLKRYFRKLCDISG